MKLKNEQEIRKKRRDNIDHFLYQILTTFLCVYANTYDRFFYIFKYVNLPFLIV